MTVAVNDTIERYVIAGAGPYPFSYRIFNDTDLQVYALSLASPPVPQLLVLNTHYTVTGANVSNGGSVTLLTAAFTPYAGFTLDIRSNTPDNQPTSIRNNAKFLPEIHEDAYDYLSRQVQDLARLVRASARTPDFEAELAMTLPALASRIGKYFAYDANGQPIASSGTGNDSALRTDLAAGVAALVNSLAITYLRTAEEISAGVVPTNTNFETLPYNVRRYGADVTGVLDSRTAFNSASTVNKTIRVPPGTYLINSNVTIAPQLIFDPGAVLKPAAGVVITLGSVFNAAPSQIFDLTAGGGAVIKLPRGMSTVYADWWGAKGDSVKLDNNVPILQAANALSQATGTVDGVYGGIVRLLRGNYYVSGEILLGDEVGLEGLDNFFTAIRVAPGTFPPSSYVIRVQNGTASLFNSPVRNLRIDGGNDGNITALIYAPAWQEKSGPTNLYLENFKNIGIFMDQLYGGVAQISFTQVEAFNSLDCVVGSRAIKIDASGFTVGWCTANFNEVQVGSTRAPITFTAGLALAATSGTLTSNWTHPTGAWWVTFSTGENRAVTLTNGATTATWAGGLAGAATAAANGVNPNAIGVDLNGRVIGNISDLHFEQTQIGVILNGAAKLVGHSMKSDGTGTVPKLIQCSGGWTGQINMTGVPLAGSAAYITDNSRGPYPLALVEPYDGNIIWPPSPDKPFAAARFTAGGGTPVVTWGVGFTPVSRVGVGQYRFNLVTAAFALSSYAIKAQSQDNTSPRIVAVNGSSSQFDVFTTSAAGAATDCAAFYLEAVHQS